MVGAQLGSVELSDATILSIILGVGLCLIDNGRPKYAIMFMTSTDVKLGM